MPYELSFVKRVPISDRDQYINECCVGGDAVVDELLPVIQRIPEYSHIQSNQEDWGWFIWFRKGPVRLAIDVHTDDGDAGEFRARLTSTLKRFLWRYAEIDTPELEELLQLVVRELKRWSGSDVRVERD